MKKQPSDSLELMLDAICNVFGAVLIIAITVGGIAVTGKLLKNNSAITAGQLEKQKWNWQQRKPDWTMPEPN